jgi:hypothetical protein
MIHQHFPTPSTPLHNIPDHQLHIMTFQHHTLPCAMGTTETTPQHDILSNTTWLHTISRLPANNAHVRRTVYNDVYIPTIDRAITSRQTSSLYLTLIALSISFHSNLDDFSFHSGSLVLVCSLYYDPCICYSSTIHLSAGSFHDCYYYQTLRRPPISGCHLVAQDASR